MSEANEAGLNEQQSTPLSVVNPLLSAQSAQECFAAKTRLQIAFYKRNGPKVLGKQGRQEDV
jgi:hypothetical protein